MGTPSRRSLPMLVQALQDIQDRCGWLPPDELAFLALRARVPLCRVEEIASFFPGFRRREPVPITIQICQDMTCHLHGAAKLRNAEQLKEPHTGESIRVEPVSCLGRCDGAPVVCVSRHAPGPA